MNAICLLAGEILFDHEIAVADDEETVEVRELLAFCERAEFRMLAPVVEAKCGPTDEDLADCRLLGERLAEAAGLA